MFSFLLLFNLTVQPLVLFNSSLAFALLLATTEIVVLGDFLHASEFLVGVFGVTEILGLECSMLRPQDLVFLVGLMLIH